MSSVRYQALGPLLSGEGSRAFIGLEITPDEKAFPVVLVWVPEAAEKDPALLERIRGETEHASKLDHPNILGVHGFAKLDEGHARVVEFADGESLRKVIERAKTIAPAFAARIICDAAMGLHYAHVAGNDDGSPLIHGDLRPETMLLSFTGEVKVTGYGALAFAPREHGGQRVKGRRVHIAPEQIIAGRESYSLQTDVYLLGVTLFECLTGVVPFADQADFFDHAVLTLPLPPTTPGLVPEALEKVLLRACAKKVTERFATALAFKEAVEAAMGGTLPSTDEVAAFLRPLFPDSDTVRAARRQAINDGIAEFARKQWGAKTPLQTPAVKTPMATPVAVAPIPVRAPAPRTVTQPPRPAPRPAPPPEPEPEPKFNWSFPVAVVGGLALAGAAVWWTTRPAEPLPSVKRFQAAIADAGAALTVRPAPPAVDLADAAVEVAEAPAADAGAAAPLLAPPSPPVAAVVDAGAPKPAVAIGPTMLKLTTTPSVEVNADGKLLGKTPFTIELAPGKLTLTLENKDLGVSGKRTLVLKPGNNVEEITFGTGVVVLSAPDGAAVFMDGKRIGTAPMPEIKVYEGAHRILVMVGKAKWNESFGIHAGENVHFNVEAQ